MGIPRGPDVASGVGLGLPPLASAGGRGCRRHIPGRPALFIVSPPCVSTPSWLVAAVPETGAPARLLAPKQGCPTPLGRALSPGILPVDKERGRLFWVGSCALLEANNRAPHNSRHVACGMWRPICHSGRLRKRGGNFQEPGCGAGKHSNICSWKVQLRARSCDDSGLLGVAYRPQQNG